MIVSSMRLIFGVFLIIAAMARADTNLTPAWEYLKFDLPSGAKEALWRDALAAKLNGKTEVKIEGGRIDVVTSNCVIEVDWPEKWHEGLGQALHYADTTGKQGVLALISYSQGLENLQSKSRERFNMVEKECRLHGLRLIILFPARVEDKDVIVLPESDCLHKHRDCNKRDS